MFSIEQVARIAHEAIVALCNSTGDVSNAPWDEAPEWQRTSSIRGVRFHLENPEATPDDIHERWMREKLESGWRYGNVKDDEARTHPCIVAYEQLPPEQKAKDYLFKAVVLALAPFIRQ